MLEAIIIWSSKRQMQCVQVFDCWNDDSLVSKFYFNTFQEAYKKAYEINCQSGLIEY